MALSNINSLLTAIWEGIRDRIPALSNGKIPVDVELGGVSISLGDTPLQIANDDNNPVPISDAGGSITVDGSVSISNFPATQVVNTGLSQPLTDAQLRNTPVSVTGTFWQTTQPISAANLPLPSDAATSALQTTGNISLASIDTKTPALGQALAAASTPVVLPASQIAALTPTASVGITGTLPAFASTPTVNIGNVPNLTFTNTSFTANAGIDLNTSVLALESDGNLAGINGKLPALSNGRIPVDVASSAPGLAWVSTATITRSADTTAYTATSPIFDVYGGLFELENIGEAGKAIFLSYFEVSLNLSAVPQGMTSFTVYLYPIEPTNIADNNIWTIGSDPVLDPVGFNVSMSLAKGGDRVVGVVRDLNQLFILTSTSLWGYLVTDGAFTPAADGETGTIRSRSFAP